MLTGVGNYFNSDTVAIQKRGHDPVDRTRRFRAPGCRLSHLSGATWIWTNSWTMVHSACRGANRGAFQVVVARIEKTWMVAVFARTIPVGVNPTQLGIDLQFRRTTLQRHIPIIESDVGVFCRRRNWSTKRISRRGSLRNNRRKLKAGPKLTKAHNSRIWYYSSRCKCEEKFIQLCEIRSAWSAGGHYGDVVEA